MLNNYIKIADRAGCKDIWNAFMNEDAIFGKYDIPFCPTTALEIPKDQVTWEEAKKIHKNHITRREYDYYEDVYINWYIDDYKFDNSRGIWHDYRSVLNIIKHFAGAITPDFSTYQDFPYPIKIQATYRMRTYGYWLGKQGVNVINNVRWGTSETYDYCFEGIPKNSIVSIGTVGGGPRKLIDRKRFEDGLYKMVEVLKPHTILVYGSAKGKCFDELRKRGIKIVSYKSSTARYYERRKLLVEQ
ncbi:protein of unknown function [Lachnospiraceae bacterium RM5]|nr:protein of unknown function [Lachnospiraceae bacterium RM5]